MADRPGVLGPVQLLVIAFAAASFDGRIIEELRRLRERTRSACSTSSSSPRTGTARWSSSSRAISPTRRPPSTAPWSGRCSGSVSAARRRAVQAAVGGRRGHPERLPARPGEASGSSPTRSPRDRRRRSPCSSTAGRSRCATRSRPPTATTWSTPGSTREDLARSERLAHVFIPGRSVACLLDRCPGTSNSGWSSGLACLPGWRSPRRRWSCFTPLRATASRC